MQLFVGKNPFTGTFIGVRDGYATIEDDDIHAFQNKITIHMDIVKGRDKVLCLTDTANFPLSTGKILRLEPLPEDVREFIISPKTPFGKALDNIKRRNEE